MATAPTSRTRAAKTVEKTEDTEALETVETPDLETTELNDEEDNSPIRELTPTDLRRFKEDDFLLVRNNTETTVVWSESYSKGGDMLRLERRGNLGSIQPLPLEIAKKAAFQRFWRQGKVTVTDDIRLEIELDQAAEAQREYDRLESVAINGLISENNNSVSIKGILPIPKPAGAENI